MHSDSTSRDARRRRHQRNVAIIVFLIHRRAAFRRRLAYASVPRVLALGRDDAWGVGDVVVGRLANQHRNLRWGFWEARLNALDDNAFKRRYKVGKVVFQRMVETLRGRLEPDHTRAIASSGSPVSTELKLSMTLRYLAGR